MTHPIEVHQVDFVVRTTGVRRATCDICGGRARYAGLGGEWCPGHWVRRKRAQIPKLEQTAHELGLRYRVDALTLITSLSDTFGYVRIRPTTAPLPRWLWHPDPTTLVDRLLSEDAPVQRAELQLYRMNTALWGLALRWGSPLQDYPRDAAHAPEDVPWGLVDWMEGDARALQHLRISGMRLREFCRRRFKRDCLAAKRLTWLLEHVEIGSLPILPGQLLPPQWDAKVPA